MLNNAVIITRNRLLTKRCTSCTLNYMKTVISATEARNNFFEMLNSVIYKGEEFIVEKDGKPAAKVSPVVSRRDPKKIEKTLREFRRVFAKSAKRKYWSVIDTPAWKKEERKYLEDLSNGIIK